MNRAEIFAKQFGDLVMMSFVSKKICNQLKVLKSSWSNLDQSSSNKQINVLFMPFMGSVERYEKHYIQLYEKCYRTTNRSVNILVAQGSIREISQYSHGKDFSCKIIDAMDKNFDQSSKVIIHAISVGNFIHSLLLYHNLVEDYQSRIACQIYDSPMYGGKMKIGGFEKSIDNLVENALIKSKIRSPLFERILKVMAIKCFQTKINYWDDVVSTWESQSIYAPILTFYSSDDKFCDATRYEELMNKWKIGGVDIAATNFKPSSHAQHLRQYPDIYEKNLIEFLLKWNI